METIQALVVAVILVLTVMLVIIGLQVFYILRDLRRTIDKANRVLDNTESITESVNAPMSSFSSLLMGLQSGKTVVSLLNRIREKKKQKT